MKHIDKNGFTLFFAMLVGSLALAVGLAIYDLTVREINLSALATQSQYAIYAADTGVECALYWDAKYVDVPSNNNGGSNSVFASSTADTLRPLTNVVCNGQDIAAGSVPWTVTAVAGAATTTFTMAVSAQSLSGLTTWASVIVAKNGNPPQTTISSHGYNTNAIGLLQLERAIQVSY